MNSHVFQSANEHKGIAIRPSPGDAVAQSVSRILCQADIWVTQTTVTWRKDKERCVFYS